MYISIQIVFCESGVDIDDFYVKLIIIMKIVCSDNTC